MTDDYPASRIKHIELIQSTVARLASHSFAVKGVAVTVGSAVAAFVIDKSRPSAAVLALVSIAACWFIDASYLYRERLFRAMHDRVRAETGRADFNMDPSRFVGGDCTLRKAFCSWSQVSFYPPLLFVLLAATSIAWKA